MKAAIVNQKGTNPVYGEFEQPNISEGKNIVNVIRILIRDYQI